MSEINFYQGTRNLFNVGEKEDTDQITTIRTKIAELFKLKNVFFLFGSGTSSGAIPIMSELHQKVIDKVNQVGGVELEILQSIKQEIDNFEQLLGILYAQQTYLKNQIEPDTVMCEGCDNLIKIIECTIFEEINVDISENQEVLEIYKSFYRKVSLRNKDLSRICVFTTNNDLFNESALDSINVNYINGFSGGLNRYFNPAFFNYSFSKRMDTSMNKYEEVENIIYLYKLHGSINWIEDDTNRNAFFDISEVVSRTHIEYQKNSNTLIYPTPTKQNKSLGTPYTELFREFQKKMLEPHSVLFVIGYGFNDEHVNHVIHQALATNSSLIVVIFKELSNEVKLGKIDESRIFKIWGKSGGDKITHFDFIVKNFLQDVSSINDSKDILEAFINSLKEQ